MIYRKGKNIPNEIKNKYDYYGKCSDNYGNDYVFWTNSKNQYNAISKNWLRVKKDKILDLKMIKGIENYRAQVIKRLEKR